MKKFIVSLLVAIGIAGCGSAARTTTSSEPTPMAQATVTEYDQLKAWYLANGRTIIVGVEDHLDAASDAVSTIDLVKLQVACGALSTDAATMNDYPMPVAEPQQHWARASRDLKAMADHCLVAAVDGDPSKLDQYVYRVSDDFTQLVDALRQFKDS